MTGRSAAAAPSSACQALISSARPFSAAASKPRPPLALGACGRRHRDRGGDTSPPRGRVSWRQSRCCCDPVAALRPDRGRVEAAVHDRQQALGQRLPVALGKAVAVDALDDHLAQGAHVRAQDRDAERHRLERLDRRDRLAKWQRLARIDHEVAQRVPGADLLVRHAAGEDHLPVELPLGHLLAQAGEMGAVADHQQAPVGPPAGDDPGERLDQVVQALIVLGPSR